LAIYRRDNGYYYAYCPWRAEIGLPPRLSLKTQNKKAAEQKYEQLKYQESYEGRLAKPQRIRIKDYFDLYLTEYSKQNKTPKNYQIDRNRLHIMADYFAGKGIYSLSQLTHRTIEGLKKHLIDCGKSPKTVNHYLGHLKTALNIATRWGYIRENPAVFLKPLPVTNVRAVPYLTEPEIKRLLNIADDESREYIILILNTGLRLSEMINLRWDDIDLIQRVITVQASPGFSPKSRKVRHIEINRSAHRLLKSLPRPGPYVFSNENGAPRYKDSEIYTRRIKNALIKAGFSGKPLGAHLLRHTFISHLLLKGAPIRVVQELAGHADISTTMRYAHLSPHHRREVIEIIGYS
jgi:integrase